MSNDLLLIDATNTSNKVDDDLVTIRFKNEEDLQVNFSRLVQQSKYVRDNYAYADFVESVQFELDKIVSTTSISEGSIREFLELVQAGRASIAVEHCRDIYALSEHFGTPNLREALDAVLESKLCKDVGFSIGVLLGSNGARDSAETALARKVEHFLSGRLSECLSHARFGDLPVSTVYRIVSESGEDGIDHDQLLDFVLSSAERRLVLLNLVVPHLLSDGGLSSLVGFMSAQEGESASKFSGLVRFDIDLVRTMNRKLEESEARNKEATEELNEERAKHESTKEELSKCERRLKHLEEEILRAKSEKEQQAPAIVAGGLNDSGGLGAESNSEDPNGFPIISPPTKLPLDPSSLRSYSANASHSVAVTNGGSLLGSGLKCMISSSMGGDASLFTEFSIRDSSGRRLDPVSAVCTASGTLYMLAKTSGSGRQLVICDFEINGGREVFLDIGDSS